MIVEDFEKINYTSGFLFEICVCKIDLKADSVIFYFYKRTRLMNKNGNVNCNIPIGFGANKRRGKQSFWYHILSMTWMSKVGRASRRIN